MKWVNSAIEVSKDIWTLVVGLAITGKYFVSPHRTTYYPRETVDKSDADTFRGPIELVGTEKDPTTPTCISCLMCVQACPGGCITVKKQPPPVMTPEEQKAFDDAVARGEKPKKPAAPKNPAVYHYNFTYCSLCGCCVEACPVGSIRFSHEIYLAGSRREDFHLDLLARLKRTAANKAAPKKAAPGSGQSSKKEDSP